MGPTIILDKSALQSFSKAEIAALHRYYQHNVVPVLLIEILGDLKKPSQEAASTARVGELASKIYTSSAVQSIHYSSLLIGSLIGDRIEMAGKPILGHGRNVQNTYGEKGIVFDETPEEKALQRWRDNDFDAAEEALSDRWRSTTRDLNLEALRDTLKSVCPKLQDIGDRPNLYRRTEELLQLHECQTNLLVYLLNEFCVDQNYAQQIFLRWESQGPRDLQQFAPFAFYCLKVNVFFHLGLMHNLIGTRSTNRVDLEYLYYLPFCNAFCSGDKFHEQIVPLFLRSDQVFIQRDDLKPDLSSLAQNLSERNGSPTVVTPENSVTASLWQRFMNRPMSVDGWLSPEKVGGDASRKLAEFIRSHLKTEDLSEEGHNLTTDNACFVARKFSIRGSDPCPCGSQKPFAECHGAKHRN